MATGYHYNFDLPDDLSTILEQDFWMLENIGANMLASLSEPVKIEITTCIIVHQGDWRADINLVSYEGSGPSLLILKSSQIMQPTFISPDFRASVIVMSKRFRDNLFMFLNNGPLYQLFTRHPAVDIPDDIVPAFDTFIKNLRRILGDTGNPYSTQALLFFILSFIYGTGYRCYKPFQDEISDRQGRISDRFMALVQEHFRKERFLDFYAAQMEITPKHLSRTVKAQTGFTAVEWIERFVILEAKLLLKSSNLNIQQISDELNFPSQSFFGKYFKKITGMSPREFRNSEV